MVTVGVSLPKPAALVEIYDRQESIERWSVRSKQAPLQVKGMHFILSTRPADKFCKLMRMVQQSGGKDAQFWPLVLVVLKDSWELRTNTAVLENRHL